MNPNLLMGAEWRALSEMSRLLGDPVYYGVGIPYGDAKPIVLIPGFMRGDWSVALLAQWLRRMGYRPALSGIDVNARCPRAVADWFVSRVGDTAQKHGQKVVLIGHSKGGYIARYIAQTHPHLVSYVIALGAPYKDPLDANWLVRLWVMATVMWNQVVFPLDRTEPECYSVACPCGFGGMLQRALPIGVGYTAIYTPTDGITRWTNCLDFDGGRNIEVQGSHLGLTVNADVYRHLAALLRAIPVQPLP